VQTVFIKLWKNPHVWQPEKGRFTTWFYRVVLNACYDYHRKQKPILPLDIQALETIVEPIESEQGLLEQKQALI
jgi:RNA polymerase sigma-70 factor (ECF subfamily)